MDKRRSTLDRVIARCQKQMQNARIEAEIHKRNPDTQREIIIGTLIFEMLENEELGEDFLNSIRNKLDSYLVRPIERALFKDMLGE